MLPGALASTKQSTTTSTSTSRTLPTHFPTTLVSSKASPSITIVSLEKKEPCQTAAADDAGAVTATVAWPMHLREKLTGDVLVAATVTAAVAPFLTVIDKALVQYSAGITKSLAASVYQNAAGILQAPGQFLKSPTFLWMWATYASTYAAANSLRTVTEHVEYRQARNANAASSAKTFHGGSTMVVFMGTTAMNTSASLMKDRAYARMFGSATAVQLTVPAVSYGFWMMRDFTVIGSSFVLPAHVAAVLEESCEMNAHDATAVAQLATPITAQLIAGPLHYVGLDFFNRPSTPLQPVSMAERAQFLYNGFVPVVAARMVRVLPGYGIAGVYNTKFRAAWRDFLIQRQMGQLMAHASSEGTNVRQLVELIRAKKQEEQTQQKDGPPPPQA